MRQVTKREQGLLKLPTKKRVAAYCRVSLEKESMMHSLSAQVSYYSEFIQNQRGWQYVGVYADDGITGTSSKRPEFLRLLADARQGKIDMIITKSISRWARNTVTMLEAVRELKEKNVDVYFERENIHSMSGDGELMLTILASFAQEESRSVSENCKWRIRNKYKDGIPNTFSVYGYKVNKGNLEINESEAKVIGLIYLLFLKGLGRLAIAKKLNDEGYRTRNNKLWDSPKVKEILLNEKYAGDLLMQKHYVENHLTKKTVKNSGQLPMYIIENNHAPIIERDTFDLVQQEFATRSKNYKRSESMPYPFTGRIKCGNCGANYQRKINNAGTKYQKAVWICPVYNLQGKSKCQSKQIPENILEDLVCEVLGLPNLDKMMFCQKIKEIRVEGSNMLNIIFNDNSSFLREWKYQSKSKSWGEEARKAARDRGKRQAKGAS